MELDDEVAHVRIVHGLLLCFDLSGSVRGCIIRIHSDGFDFFDIFECRMLKVDQFATDDEMKQLMVGVA